jgi:hypothetical protein
MIAVIITFRKSNKNLLECRDGAYWSSRKINTLYIPVSHSLTRRPLYIFMHPPAPVFFMDCLTLEDGTDELS